MVEVQDGLSTAVRYGWGPAHEAPRDVGWSNGDVEALRVPVREGQRHVRVELWGSRVEGGPEERIGCEEVPVGRGADVVFEIGPLRADGPESCR